VRGFTYRRIIVVIVLEYPFEMFSHLRLVIWREQNPIRRRRKRGGDYISKVYVGLTERDGREEMMGDVIVGDLNESLDVGIGK